MSPKNNPSPRRHGGKTKAAAAPRAKAQTPVDEKELLQKLIRQRREAARQAEIRAIEERAAIGELTVQLRETVKDPAELTAALAAAGIEEREAKKCFSIYKRRDALVARISEDAQQLTIPAAHAAMTASAVSDLFLAAQAGTLDGIDFVEVQEIDELIQSRLKNDLSAARQHRATLAALARAAIAAHPLPQTAAAAIAAAKAWAKGGVK